MSVDVYAFWQGEPKLDKATLQSALAELGFEARVLHEFNEADAFWPIDLAGFKTGVEIYLLTDLEETREDYPDLMPLLGERDRGALFTFGSNAAEAGTAVALAAALAKAADALVYDPQSSTICSIDQLVGEAKQFFEDALKEGAQQRQH
ncbi:MAG TPA: hypothetical protein VEC14_10995 [Reyranellaceae bacterium]|nr:hypothetical protein [Reyranellaceae bacterium]